MGTLMIIWPVGAAIWVLGWLFAYFSSPYREQGFFEVVTTMVICLLWLPFVLVQGIDAFARILVKRGM
jgi:hypothetical protein